MGYHSKSLVCSMFHVPCSMKQKGSILLEVFIAVMVISIAFAILLDVGGLSVKTSTSIRQNEQANFLMKESMEAVRSFRDGSSWGTGGLGTLAIGNAYYPLLDTSATPNKWNIVSGTETVGLFTRKIIVDKVSRDPTTQNIESTYNAARDDPNTRKVTVTVASSTRTLSLVSYFTNWK